MIYILISAFFFGSYGIWSRLMVGEFGEFSQAWTRGLFLLIVILILNWRFRFIKAIEQKDWKWFIPIALAGGINQAPYFLGFEHLGIGTATLLFYAALTIGGYLLGVVFFNEKISRIKYLSLSLAVIGMFMIYRFNLTLAQIFPATMTIFAGLLGATTVILPKKLLGQYDELQIMLGYFLAQIIFNLPLSLLLHNSLPPLSLSRAWFGQLGYAISMLIANYSAIEGFRRLEPSVGSLIGLAEIIFGLLFGIIFFKETLSASIVLGSVFIILAAALPNLRKE